MPLQVISPMKQLNVFTGRKHSCHCYTKYSLVLPFSFPVWDYTDLYPIWLYKKQKK